MRICQLPTDECLSRFRTDGIAIRVGPFVIRLKSPLADVGRELAFLYADFPLADNAFVDHEVSVTPTPLLPWRATILADGVPVYSGIPRRVAVPLTEWTLNLCVFHRASIYLMVHSAVVERQGKAALLVAPQGSGKSTLCAALIHRGWRLLSDEVAMIDLRDGRLLPVPRPVSLKNDSIDVIRRFAPGCRMGPLWPGTSKGTIAHLLPPTDSVDRAQERACPRWILFPQYAPDQVTALHPLSKAHALVRAAAEAFNYTVLGKAGFRGLTELTDVCDSYELIHGSLEDAVALLDDLESKSPAESEVDRAGCST